MPQGDKSKYTDKQKRMAQHIEDGYREKGLSEDVAEARAWATVNAIDGGGKKPGGSGRAKARNPAAAKKGGTAVHAKQTATKSSKKTTKSPKAAARRKSG